MKKYNVTKSIEEHISTVKGIQIVGDNKFRLTKNFGKHPVIENGRPRFKSIRRTAVFKANTLEEYEEELLKVTNRLTETFNKEFDPSKGNIKNEDIKTLQDVYEIWKNTEHTASNNGKALKNTTKNKYNDYLTKYLLPFLGEDREMKKIDEELLGLLYHYYSNHSLDGTVIKRSVGSLKDLQKAVNSLFKLAYDKGFIYDNVALKVKPNFKNAPTPKVVDESNIYTFDEIEKVHDVILKKVETAHQKRYVFSNKTSLIMFYLITHIQLRRSELLALKWTDIDFDKKILTIQSKLVYDDNRKQYVLSDEKHKRVMLSDGLIKALKEYREVWYEFHDELLQYIEPEFEDLIFLTSNVKQGSSDTISIGGPFNPDSVNQKFKRIHKEAKVRWFGIDTYRDTLSLKADIEPFRSPISFDCETSKLIIDTSLLLSV